MLVLLTVMVVAPLARRINDLYEARSIERANPGFRNALTAALQFGDGDDVDPALMRALKRRASRQAAAVDPDQAVSARGLHIAAAAFGIAAVAVLLYAIVSPKPLWPSLQRAFGNDQLQPPTATNILDVTPADGRRAIAGRPVAFTARIDQPLGPATLRISRDGGQTACPTTRSR
jgi:hypothetical protein